jgi:hypothetical protein
MPDDAADPSADSEAEAGTDELGVGRVLEAPFLESREERRMVTGPYSVQ